jgi:hypothetical protein
VIGPFPLGDLILSSPKGDWLVKDFKDGGLDVAEVKKQMNGWKLYLVDHKVRKADGQWKWYRPDRGGWGPKVLVEGRFSVEVKDRNGEKVEIALTKCDAAGTQTDHSGQGPASVRCPMAVTLRFHGLNVPLGSIHWPKEGGSMIPAILYDVTGRATVEKPAVKN